MTLQVMQLIQQWKHVAAPNSQRRSQPKQPSK